MLVVVPWSQVAPDGLLVVQFVKPKETQDANAAQTPRERRGRGRGPEPVTETETQTEGEGARREPGGDGAQ
jgi:hypothetical protein